LLLVEMFLIQIKYYCVQASTTPLGTQLGPIN